MVEDEEGEEEEGGSRPNSNCLPIQGIWSLRVLERDPMLKGIGSRMKGLIHPYGLNVGLIEFIGGPYGSAIDSEESRMQIQKGQKPGYTAEAFSGCPQTRRSGSVRSEVRQRATRLVQ
ncbi:hypothetical protein LSTR_LSTR000571 [Laodelphax striatellus]|uniref:Uncharacterized protein n=1 Tax=Laodelphax striatellus TaxID=195883 RepID=A0A482XGL2_LAOST|nr:hypothetical protein LSTR_LSTR000571 [Laodelphax striatellus]